MRVVLLAGLALAALAASASADAAAKPDCIAQVAVNQSVHRGGPVVVDGSRALIVCGAPVTAVKLVYQGVRSVRSPEWHYAVGAVTACRARGRNTMECTGLSIPAGRQAYFDAVVRPLPATGDAVTMTVTFAGGTARSYSLSYPGAGDND